MLISGSCKGLTTLGSVPGARCLSHFRVVEHIVPASYIRTYPAAIERGAETSLRLAVKQYIPLTQPESSCEEDAVTIIGGHANGFPKELYEPLWDDLYECLSQQGHSIRSIWIADIAPQGDSGRINERFLGNDPNWWDHARDLLFLINQKQTQMPQPIVGIGHSMGASILVALALLHPSLFQSLVLIDPVIQTENPSKTFVSPSTHRRDRWPSRSAAREAFAKSKFYQAWDKRVLDQWLNKGLTTEPAGTLSNGSEHSLDPSLLLSRDAASHDARFDTVSTSADSIQQPVMLMTTKAQEVFHYLRPLYKGQSLSDNTRQRLFPDVNPSDLEEGYEFYRPEPAELFRQLPQLRPGVLYCFGQSSPVATPELRRKKLKTTGIGPGGSGGGSSQRVKEAVFDAGHMLPFEQPRACAKTATEWLDSEISRWSDTEKELRQAWIEEESKRDIDEEWLRRMPKPKKPMKSA